MKNIKADSTLCPECRGTLWRKQDGEGRLSERMGRVVLECDKCHRRWSVTVGE